MINMKTLLGAIVFGVVAFLSSVTSAAHEGDIYIADQKGKLVTGRIAPGPMIQTPVNVFGATLDINDVTSNPGFDTTAGMFQVGSRIGFNVLDALLVWNGCGVEPAGAETMTISFFTLFVTTADGFVPGYDLAVQSDGGWHRHFSFFLNGDGKRPPSTGVYLLKLELYSTDPDLASSQPFWIVFNHADAEANHEQAIAWANVHLVGDVPCLADCTPDNGDGTFGDGQVTIADVVAVVQAFGSVSEACDIVPENCDGTFGDGEVSIGDIIAVVTEFGSACSN
jgi:hypothetical protein